MDLGSVVSVGILAREVTPSAAGHFRMILKIILKKKAASSKL